MLVPRQAYLTKGIGGHKEPLVAFEIALRDAGISAQNLVAVSSILPPGCELISRGEGERHLRPGQILHVVMSRNETNEAHRCMGASIGIARPDDATHHGFVAEHHDFGHSEEDMGAYAEDLAATMLATTLGVEFDPDLPWVRRARIYRDSGRIRDTFSVNAVVSTTPRGVWTCAVAACVFLMEWMLPVA